MKKEEATYFIHTFAMLLVGRYAITHRFFFFAFSSSLLNFQLPSCHETMSRSTAINIIILCIFHSQFSHIMQYYCLRQCFFPQLVFFNVVYILVWLFDTCTSFLFFFFLFSKVISSNSLSISGRYLFHSFFFHQFSDFRFLILFVCFLFFLFILITK